MFSNTPEWNLELAVTVFAVEVLVLVVEVRSISLLAPHPPQQPLLTL